MPLFKKKRAGARVYLTRPSSSSAIEEFTADPGGVAAAVNRLLQGDPDHLIWIAGDGRSDEAFQIGRGSTPATLTVSTDSPLVSPAGSPVFLITHPTAADLGSGRFDVDPETAATLAMDYLGGQINPALNWE